MKNAESSTKQLSRDSILCHSTEICPKCQNLLTFSGIQQTDRGGHLLYSCSECSAEFAFVPVTEFRLFEVIPK